MDQTTLPAHSEAKIKLLSGYLGAYLEIISRDKYTTKIFLADVFCGPGSYENGKIGSPVVIARKLAALHAGNASAPETFLLANDKKSANISSVESLVRPLDLKHEKLTIQTTQEDAAAILKNLSMQSLGEDEKRFLFVDPFGYKDLAISDILDLLKGGKTELLLFQPCSFMHRFSEKATPGALEAFLKELSAGNPWPSGLSTYEYVYHTKELLQQRVGNSFFVDSFTIKKDSRNIYCLFFFSPHIRGFEKMLESKWKMDGLAGTNWHFDDASAGGLFAENNPITGKLEKGLLEFLDVTVGRANYELYEQTLRLGFLPKHANELLTSLEKRGLIRVSIIDGRKGYFYLNYDNFSSRTRKIEIFKVA